MNSSSLKTQSQFEGNRYYGFDLIRIFSLFAIIIFHVYETIIFKDEVPAFLSHSLHSLLLYYARVLTASGFTIVALSSLLVGFRKNQNWGRLLIIAFLGFFLLAWVEAPDTRLGTYFEWDIYPYLLVSFTPLYFAQKKQRVLLGLGVLGFLLLLIPFWQFAPDSNSTLSTFLIGTCQKNSGTMWPLFPWIGLVWCFYTLGYFIKRNSQFNFFLKNMHAKEKIIWLVLVLSALPHVGAYFDVPIGPGFPCYVFRKSLFDFWGHMILVLFAMRLSLLDSINLRLSKINLCRKISNLCWSQHFGACYILHLLVMGGFSLAGYDFYATHTLLFDAVVVLTMPLTEILCRLGLKAITDTRLGNN